ncbi:MAG: tRNA (guanosine(37)-N1)-methyltransferase TrmD [Candidatus Gracilibacteria bacterium]|nr:tRNA (guanosine(37)-N1)-methyltransferase TrmD [Candidatus Gracilibacteria bacterium]
MFSSVFEENIFLRGIKKGLVQVNLVNLRDYCKGPHKQACLAEAPKDRKQACLAEAQKERRQADDRPFGGGAGMLLMPEPLFACIEDLQKKFPKAKVIFLTPQGKKFTQKTAMRYAKKEDLILLCGHYEGIDQRVRDSLVDEEISIGDYVLTGGEIPAMILVNAISRMLPGFLGKDESAEEDSFMPALGGKKEYPHYTRPADFRGMKVPDVLLSGNHAEISKWRMKHLK